MITKTAKFKFVKETKGAVQFKEVAEDGSDLDQNSAIIGSLYLRKHALKGIPKRITVTVEYKVKAEPIETKLAAVSKKTKKPRKMREDEE